MLARMNDQYQRMLDKSVEPSQEDMLKTIGMPAASAWNDIHTYIRDNYDHIPVKRHWGKKHGWAIQYRKSSKTLCTLVPETGAFTALLIFGKKEVEKIAQQAEQISPAVLEIIDNTTQLHDGKWVFIRLLDSIYVDDIKKLIGIKRRPRLK
jgi:hypothetical protein